MSISELRIVVRSETSIALGESAQGGDSESRMPR